MAVIIRPSLLASLALVVSAVQAGPIAADRRRAVVDPRGTCDKTWLDMVAKNSLSTENITVTAMSATHVHVNQSFGGGKNPSYGDEGDAGFPLPAYLLPELCAVHLNVTDTTERPLSTYEFGMFLPADWNGRFLAVGSSSFAGGINWPQAGEGAHYGFATASTNNGHNGDLWSQTFAVDEAARLDWGYRAMHGTVQLAKQLTNLYYPTNFTYSYYSGCSTGGRQGLREIQVDVNSFDGALIGAPAWDTEHVMPYLAKLAYEFNVHGGALTTRQVQKLAKETLDQCDFINGTNSARDGIIDDPDLCLHHPDPARRLNLTSVTCNGQDTPASAGCLTPDQTRIINDFLYGGYNTSGAHLVSRGFDVGSEITWNMFEKDDQNQSWLAGFDRDYERYFLGLGQSVKPDVYSDNLVAQSEQQNPGRATARPSDLSSFRQRSKMVDNRNNVGGKIIMYHGMADGLLPRKQSLYFWEQTKQLTGIRSDADMNSFFRYFEIPGMRHCAGAAELGSPVAWDIGGAGMAAGLLQGSLSGLGYSVNGHESDGRYDALVALQGWVENGTAVDSLVATSGFLPNTTKYVERVVCPYPQRANFMSSTGADPTNSADAFNAANWHCGERTVPAS